MAFLSVEKLEKLIENETSDAIKWSELSKNNWYKIKNISDNINSKYGDSYILNLIDREEKCFNVWSIPNLIKKLKFKLGNNFNKFDNYTTYCQSLGIKKSANNRNYFNFKVVFEENATKKHKKTLSK